MSCNACGKVYDLSALTCIKDAETVAEHLVSAGNKLSIAKFLCPEPGCGRSVDVKYLADGKVNIARYHSAPGERVSMVGGRGRKVVVPSKPPTFAMVVEQNKRNEEARHNEMVASLELAEDTVKSADLKIEAQVALIKAAEARIEEIKRDRVLAEEILTNPDFTQYRKAVEQHNARPINVILCAVPADNAAG